MDQPVIDGTIHKLQTGQNGLLEAHLLRLDDISRRARFGMAVSDTFIRSYVRGIGRFDSLLYAYISGGNVHAAAELRLARAGFATAEAAFSVESAWQDNGIGSALLGRIIRSGRNRGVRRIVMNCLLENRRMQHIASKYDADLRFDHGEVVGELTRGPNFFSLWREQMEDRMGLAVAVLDAGRKREKPAA